MNKELLHRGGLPPDRSTIDDYRKHGCEVVLVGEILPFSSVWLVEVYAALDTFEGGMPVYAEHIEGPYTIVMKWCRQLALQLGAQYTQPVTLGDEILILE